MYTTNQVNHHLNFYQAAGLPIDRNRHRVHESNNNKHAPPIASHLDRVRCQRHWIMPAKAPQVLVSACTSPACSGATTSNFEGSNPAIKPPMEKGTSGPTRFLRNSTDFCALSAVQMSPFPSTYVKHTPTHTHPHTHTHPSEVLPQVSS